MSKKQKFPRGSFVKVTDKMPKSMEHFEKGFTGIVEGTYAQLFGGGLRECKLYSLIQLDEKGNPINSISWYKEDQLTLVDSDVSKGKEIIEQWNFGEE